jgi:hypothetical protein
VAYWNSADTYFVKRPNLRCHILADYIFLDKDERLAFAEKKHEYLIETVQSNKSTILTNKYIENLDQLTVSLNYTNICKYLIWSMKIKYINQANTVINNINSIINWNDYEFYDDLRAFDSFHLKLNHVSRESKKYASMVDINFYEMVQVEVDQQDLRESKLQELI